MNWQNGVEIGATALNVLFLLLLMKEKRMAWVYGGVASLLSILLFIEGKLYSEAILYTYYVGIAAYSFVRWGNSGNSALKIHEFSLYQTTLAVLYGICAALMMGWFFHRYTDASFPYVDAFTTIFSFIATYMEARKIRSAWIWWLLINLASARLYFLKEFYLMSGQMIFFAILCIRGYREWNQRMKGQTT